MSNPDIITNQFVRITQTPASIGERVLARILDWIFMFIYGVGLVLLLINVNFSFIGIGAQMIGFFLITMPLWLYDFLWETFNNGQSPGKMIMKIRVVNQDGSRPTMGSFFMRWLLEIVDFWFSGIGLLFILLTTKSQRLGDLAAGTIVIKLINIQDIHVSLDEFYYAKKDYHPQYEQAKNLSQAQVAVIEKVLYSQNDDREVQIAYLADKVKKFLKITNEKSLNITKDNNKEKFLATILHDYQYYMMALI